MGFSKLQWAHFWTRLPGRYASFAPHCRQGNSFWPSEAGVSASNLSVSPRGGEARRTERVPRIALGALHELRGERAGRMARRHAVPAQARGPEEAREEWIGPDHEPLVGSEGPEARPRAGQRDVGQGGQVMGELPVEEVDRRRVDVRDPR